MDISSTLILVLVGLFLIGALSGVMGTYTFLRKQTLVGDAIAHSVLPGVAIGFMFSGTKDPLFLLLGGSIFGYFSILCIEWIVRYSKLSTDSAIAIVTSVYFALGSVFLSVISSQENGQQAGLQDFLFGKAATMTEADVSLFFVSSLIIIIPVILFFRPFFMIAFNPDFAASQGWNTKFYINIMSILTVVVITIGLQAVGVVLMSAMLIAPAAAARYWTDSLKKMIVLSTIFGAIAGVGGGLLSLVGSNMPTGPWVVMFLFLITAVTLLVSPGKGFISIQRNTKENQRKMDVENLLKTLYYLKEQNIAEPKVNKILDARQMDSDQISNAMKVLRKNNWTTYNRADNALTLTDTGYNEGKRVVRLHRLWELYLTNRMNFKHDHIHGTAETIEHLLTPELEQALLKELDHPELDPHNKEIPYN